jgi:hypothetical protein
MSDNSGLEKRTTAPKAPTVTTPRKKKMLNLLQHIHAHKHI